MPPAKISDLQGVFTNFISYALGFAGIVLFVMLIIGGVKYITSGGDPKSTEGAKNTITYALLGLGLILVAFLILQLIKAITGANVTEFRVTQP